MTASEPQLIYVFLPEPLGPIDRGDKYEDPIIDELERLGLGEVTGGGTGMGDEGPDGQRQIQSCGIDVETTNIEAARAALRSFLPKLGCRAGTQLQFTVGQRDLQDEFDGNDWRVDQERTPSADAFYLGRSS